jgi:rubredoxin
MVPRALAKSGGNFRGGGMLQRLGAAAEAPPTSADDPYLVHVCTSCDYEYDEKKGFKKRVSPGSRIRDMATFMCPVCGAAIDQFTVKGESP